MGFRQGPCAMKRGDQQEGAESSWLLASDLSAAWLSSQDGSIFTLRQPYGNYGRIKRKPEKLLVQYRKSEISPQILRQHW